MESAARATLRSRTRAIAWIACIFYCAVTLTVAAARAREDQSSTSDFDDFWNTARHFVRTGEVTEQFGVHNYPPFFVLFVSPLGLLPLKVACVLFNALSILAAVVAIRRWDSAESAPSERGMATLLILPYATACLVMGQMALLTMAMLVFAWTALERRREGLAGFWLALAIATKVYPALLLLFFAIKRCGSLLAWSAVWLGILLVALPAAFFGPSRAWSLSEAYWRRSVVGQSSLALAAGESNKMSYANQSFAIVARRLTQPTPGGVRRADGTPRFINLVDWPTERAGGAGGLARVRWLVVAWTGGLLGLAALSCAGRFDYNDLTGERREFAAFVVLALLLCPIVWSFYYCVCYPAVALLWRTAAQARRQRRFSFEGMCVIAWFAGLLALASPLARMYGLHLWITLGMFLVLLRRPATTPAASPAAALSVR